MLLSSCEVFLTDGFIYAVLAMGYYITYTILDFPDLTVEGTVLTGGIIFSLLAITGLNPWICMIIAFVFGCIAGCVTGILNVKLKIRPLLCGILVSTALITINLVVTVVGMGGNLKGEDALTNIPIGRDVTTILRSFPAKYIPQDFLGINIRKLIIFFAVAVIFKILLDVFLKTKSGLLLRASGSNPNFVTMLAKNPGNSKILGLALGNGFAAVSGALIAQSRGNANQSMGLGMIVIGLASLIIGLSVFSKVKFMKPSTKVIFGSVIYQACLSIATFLGVPTAYNKLIMAILFTIALVISGTIFKKKGSAVID
ncbi:MAG: ABC transporter permease [Oscillospiraceae bacterium]